MLSLILTILFFALLGFIAYLIIKFAFVIGLFSIACWIADKLFK